jgi:hypothetical protein
MRCAIPITTNSFRNTGGPRHLCWNLPDFSKINTTFVAYDKLFLEKISRDSLFPIHVPYGEAYIFVAIKNLARFHVQKANFLRFYICHVILIDSFRCRGHHGTSTAWFCDIIDTKFI